LGVDANDRTCGERCGLSPTCLSVTACGLKFACCQLSGQGMEDEPPHWMLCDSLLGMGIVVAFCLVCRNMFCDAGLLDTQ